MSKQAQRNAGFKNTPAGSRMAAMERTAAFMTVKLVEVVGCVDIPSHIYSFVYTCVLCKPIIVVKVGACGDSIH